MTRFISMAILLGFAAILQIIAHNYLTNDDQARLFAACWKVANMLNGAVVGLALDWWFVHLGGRNEDDRMARAILMGACVLGAAIG